MERERQTERNTIRDDHCPAIALAMEPRYSGHTGDTGLRDETGLQQCQRSVKTQAKRNNVLYYEKVKT